MLYLLLGFFFGETAGYFYHRWVLHGTLIRGMPRADGTRPVFLWVPWKPAWEKHMWHHFRMYPDPDPPGHAPVGPFRPRHTYANGLERATHPFGSVPSEHPRFDKIEWYLHKVGLRISLDWLIVASLFLAASFIVLSAAFDEAVSRFLWYAIGVGLAGFLNEIWHQSFHVRPHARLRDVPFRAWFGPSVALANLGEHLPWFRNVYRYLFLRHLAHHYEAVRVDDSNHDYLHVLPNANVANFTMFNPLTDILFGTYCGKDFEEIEAKKEA